ncbi:exosortase system-associated protein, TIGR04073 family [Nitrosomonas sp.]|uniref:exosortase system-associated protein, TIGR04073 family n=1 Tax=Nitrosomonas sp. TaxID=42353 RepID=UPI001E13CD20|nr:exosortase system-associated protein, TIGR04073 family [Nitrosomonas sp.]MBX3618349.1 exosortase system-associated protein, TIGR04073 family [Nitrosomonas sp.]
MHEITRFVFIIILPFFFSSIAMAENETTTSSHSNKSGLKLISGLTNIATGWLELPKNINIVGRQENTIASGIAAIGVGTLQGGWYTINRTGCGIFDLLTFMIPTNPSVEPIFVWNNFSRESKFMGY